MMESSLCASSGKKGSAKKGKLSGGDAEAMVSLAAGSDAQHPLVEVLQPVHDLLKKRALRERRLLLENTVG